MVHNPDSAEEGKPGLDGLTEKQREALELALDEGYFAVPRENSATELADEVGITRPAFSRRLQRAQKQVFTHLLRSPTP
jgi:predicted DNA binding protein